MKRINLMVSEEQYDKIQSKGINLSSFIRDLIDDHFSEHVVHINVSAETHQLYNEILTNTGATDSDLDPLLVEALKKLVDVRLKKIQALKTKVKK